MTYKEHIQISKESNGNYNYHFITNDETLRTLKEVIKNLGYDLVYSKTITYKDLADSIGKSGDILSTIFEEVEKANKTGNLDIKNLEERLKVLENKK